MPLASVYPLVSSRAVARPFTYEVPDDVGSGRDRAGPPRPQHDPRRRRRGRSRAAAGNRDRARGQGAGLDPAGARRARALAGGLLRHDAGARARARGAATALAARRAPLAGGARRRCAGEQAPAGADRRAGGGGRARRRRARRGRRASISSSSGRPGAARPRSISAPREAALERGLGTIVLVPEIALAPQTVGRFRERFGDTVAVLHSALGQAERRDERDRIARGEARVVVGARSAIFAPIRGLGLVVVDEEHDASYKQESDPRYDARTVAAKRAALEGAVAVYGSATPRPESWARLERLVLSDRIGAPLPRVRIVDLRRESGLPALGAAAGRARPARASDGGKAILLLNRRGVAPAIHCRACGPSRRCAELRRRPDPARATAGSTATTAATREPVPEACPACGSVELARIGAGTQRLETELERNVPELERIRLDADTAARPGALARGARALPRRRPRRADRHADGREGTPLPGRRPRGRRRRRHRPRAPRTSAPRSGRSSSSRSSPGRSGRDAPGPRPRADVPAGRDAVRSSPRGTTSRGFLAERARAARRRSATRPFRHLVAIVASGPERGRRRAGAARAPRRASRASGTTARAGAAPAAARPPPRPARREDGRAEGARPPRRRAPRGRRARDAARRPDGGRRRRSPVALAATRLDSADADEHDHEQRSRHDGTITSDGHDHDDDERRGAERGARAGAAPARARADPPVRRPGAAHAGAARSRRSTRSSRGLVGADDVAHARRGRRRARRDAGRRPAARVRLPADDGEDRVRRQPRHRDASASETEMDEEGCLSLRAVLVPVERLGRGDARGRGRRRASPFGSSSRGSPARVVQHELDHLDGILIIDRTTTEARREALARLRPQPVLRASAWPGSRVAATAPFGADVLERLAERHEVAVLLTRPTRRAGRGRSRGAAAGEARRRAARHPRAPAGASDAGVELGAPTVVVVRLRRCSIPEALLERGAWLNVHPSLLPRWRGAAPVERALLAGDDGDGRHDPPRRWRSSTRGRSPRRSAFPIGADDDAGAVYARAGGARGAAARRACSPAPPSFAPRPGEGVTYAEKIGPADRELDLDAPGERARPPGAGALAAHRRARGAPRSPGHRLAGAGRRGRRVRAARGAARRRQADGVRRSGCAACGERRDLARARPRSSVVRRVFEDDAYADRALPHRGRGARRRATARSRSSSPTAPYSGCGRSTTRSRRSDAGPSRSSTLPCARRSGSARTSSASSTASPRYAAVNESVELVRRAGLERAVAFTNAVLRRVADGAAPLVEALPEHDLGGGGSRLQNLLHDSKATVMQATPTTWRLLLLSAWQNETKIKILCGGEVLPNELAKQLLALSDSVGISMAPPKQRYGQLYIKLKK